MVEEEISLKAGNRPHHLYWLIKDDAYNHSMLRVCVFLGSILSHQNTSLNTADFNWWLLQLPSLWSCLEGHAGPSVIVHTKDETQCWPWRSKAIKQSWSQTAMLRSLPTTEPCGSSSPGFLKEKRKLLVKMESGTQRKTFFLKKSSFHSVTDQDQRASCFSVVYQSIRLSDSGWLSSKSLPIRAQTEEQLSKCLGHW